MAFSEHYTCLIIHPVFTQNRGKESRIHARHLETELEEASGLAEAIALNVLKMRTQKVHKISPAHLFGSGGIDEIAAEAEALKPNVIIVNTQLTPVQQRNLERAWNVKVIDRTGLILEIFGSRAQTKEGKIQVELAALNYQRSRLVRSWTHLERQRGGGGFMGGPGETQIELDRRMIDDKITRLKKQLNTIRRTRDLARQNRARTPFPIIALVGYTNAGKSTLFNLLTNAGVFAEDLPFATLDPTLRKIKLSNGLEVIVSDTVGFIADLPTQLIEAFKATLEQVNEADIICHVRDISSPDSNAQREDVMKVLRELGIDYETDDRIIEVLNKIDKCEPDDFPLPSRNIFPLSAVTGEGVERFLNAAAKKLTEEFETIQITIPAVSGKILAWIHEHAEILHEKLKEDEYHFTLKISPKFAEQLRAMV